MPQPQVPPLLAPQNAQPQPPPELHEPAQEPLHEPLVQLAELEVAAFAWLPLKATPITNTINNTTIPKSNILFILLPPLSSI